MPIDQKFVTRSVNATMHAGRVAPTRSLDLDDIGAEPGEELGGERERLELLEREHPNPVERPGIPQGRVVARLSKPHGERPYRPRSC